MIGRAAAQALTVAGSAAYVAGEMVDAARDRDRIPVVAGQCVGPLLYAAMVALEVSGMRQQESSAAIHDLLADYLNARDFSTGPVLDVAATPVADQGDAMSDATRARVLLERLGPARKGETALAACGRQLAAILELRNRGPDLARQVIHLTEQLRLTGNRLRAAAVNEVAKSGQTREYYEYSEWAGEIDALLSKVQS